MPTGCVHNICFFSYLQKKNKADKDLLYDRIADSYVALFTSINQDVKDKFLMVRFFTIVGPDKCAFAFLHRPENFRLLQIVCWNITNAVELICL